MEGENPVLRRHAELCQSVHKEFPLIGLSRAVHTNKRSQAMTFADKPFLIPLYQTLLLAPEAVFCKGVQTGLTEALIQLFLYQAGWNGRICAYVMPQYSSCERFVAERIDPLLLRTPAYFARLPGGEMGLEGLSSKGNLKRKRFGDIGSILFLGSNTTVDFLEFSADLVIVDEYDACDLENIAKVKDRVRESEYPQIIKVSNPRIPDVGIARLWKEGTQAKWYHSCPRCHYRQPLDWFVNFVIKNDSGGWELRDRERANNQREGDIRPICLHCKKPFDRTVEGVWVAAEPQRAVQSFHISRLNVLASKRDKQPIRTIWEEWLAAQGDSNRLAAFWTGNLGWPFESSGMRITDSVLDSAMDNDDELDYEGGELYNDHVVVCGIDVGSVWHCCVSILEAAETPSGVRRRGVWHGILPNSEAVYDVQCRYSVDVMVIDALPETSEVKRIRDHFIHEGGCQVWLNEYHHVPKVGTDAFGINMKYEEHVVQVDRTQLLDACLDDLKNGSKTYPSDSNTILHWRAQMKAPIRILDEKSQRYVWREGNDPDHFRHADAYERVAQEIHERSGGYFE